MRVNINRLLFFMMWCTIALAGPVPAQTYRQPASETMEKFRQDEDFHYQREEFQKPVFWEVFLSKVQQFMKWIFGAAPSGRNVTNFIYLLAVGILIWAIIRLAGISTNAVLSGRKHRGELAFTAKEENIHSMDFGKAMEEARVTGQWRVLIRLQYLFALKLLADADLIKVMGGKTNHDYLYEIDPGPVKQPFGRLSRIFEYTWYGHFDPSPAVLQKAEAELKTLRQQLLKR